MCDFVAISVNNLSLQVVPSLYTYGLVLVGPNNPFWWNFSEMCINLASQNTRSASAYCVRTRDLIKGVHSSIFIRLSAAADKVVT